MYDLPKGCMAMTAPPDLDIATLKDLVIASWKEDTRNWPVKVISMRRAAELGALSKRVAPVAGCVVSEKYVRGRELKEAEDTLGLHKGELRHGAVILRLKKLPDAAEFDLAGSYTNVPAYKGYRPGQGSNQWILKKDFDADVMKIAGPGQDLSYWLDPAKTR
jgi:hypothetical protein